jgi:hypothetical protein
VFRACDWGGKNLFPDAWGRDSRGTGSRFPWQVGLKA